MLPQFFVGIKRLEDVVGVLAQPRVFSSNAPPLGGLLHHHKLHGRLGVAGNYDGIALFGLLQKLFELAFRLLDGVCHKSSMGRQSGEVNIHLQHNVDPAAGEARAKVVSSKKA